MAKNEEIDYSTVIQGFIDFLQKCKSDYETEVQEVWKHDKRQQDQLHDLEFADNYDERNRIATRIHRERVERRELKDKVARLEKVSKFVSKNKQFIEGLKSLVNEQRKTEDFLDGERHYNRRVGDIDDIAGG